MKWVKYYFIIMKSLITSNTVVTLFGSTYVVAGNFVKKIR